MSKLNDNKTPKRYQNPEIFEQLAIEYAVGSLHGRARKRFEVFDGSGNERNQGKSKSSNGDENTKGKTELLKIIFYFG